VRARDGDVDDGEREDRGRAPPSTKPATPRALPPDRQAAQARGRTPAPACYSVRASAVASMPFLGQRCALMGICCSRSFRRSRTFSGSLSVRHRREYRAAAEPDGRSPVRRRDRASRLGYSTERRDAPNDWAPDDMVRRSRCAGPATFDCEQDDKLQAGSELRRVLRGRRSQDSQPCE
jgi:hypothetical protein